MNFLAILVGTVVAVVLLRKFIKKIPWVFYILAIALNVLMAANVLGTLPRLLRGITLMLMNKGGLGTAMFVIVMWIGVFPRKGVVSKALRPIRAELSIMACLLIAGHMVVYLLTYIPNMLGRSLASTAVLISLVIAFVLLALVLVLGVTSLRSVKRYMSVHAWRRLQSLAYLFYALVLAHVLFFIGPAALAHPGPTRVNAIVYLAVFGGYIVARIWRAVVDKREHVDLAKSVSDQGFVR